MIDQRPHGDDEAALALLEMSPVILAAFEGADLRLVAGNDVARRIMGGRAEFGERITDLMPEVVDQQWTAPLLQVLETGEALTLGEARLATAAPGLPAREVWVNVTFAPWHHDDGSVRGVFVSGIDVTAVVEARRRSDAAATEMASRYAQAREVVRAMQRAMLPTEVPVLPMAQVAARYTLADDESAAGGDWFDLWVTEDGHLTFVVGDVVGHGVAASAVMGQLRTVLLEHVRQGADVGQALRRLDDYAVRVPGARTATVCIAQLDPASGELTYCTAGHPPPLVLSPQHGDGRFLEPTGAGPLATGGGFRVGHDRLEVGELLLAYSDGILERPGVDVRRSTVELRQTALAAARDTLMPVAGPALAVERVCTQVCEVLTRVTGRSDDTTLLAVQRTAPIEPLAVELQSGPDAGATARSALRSWLAVVDDVDLFNAEHAVSELVANATDHAYDGMAGMPIRVDARLEPTGRLTVSVGDDGRWRPSVTNPSRGLGLAMLRRLDNDVTIDAGPAGTTVTAQHRLGRPAGLVADVPAVPPSRPSSDFSVQVDGDPPTLVVHGPIDAGTVNRFSVAVERTMASGAPVVIDLAAVTLLTSIGIHALYRAVGADRAITLRAPAASVAHQVLSTANLDHRTDAA